MRAGSHETWAERKNRKGPGLKGERTRTYSAWTVRRWILLAIVACASGAALAVACTDGGRTTVTIVGDDASGDDASADATEELIPSDTCGNAPWVNVNLDISGATLNNPDGSPLPNAMFTSPLCPGYVHYSDDAGVIRGQVSKSVPFYARLQHKSPGDPSKYDYISMLAPEESFDKDVPGIKITMLPTIYAAILPQFGPNDAAIVIALQHLNGGGDGSACDVYDGVSYSVDGHPEAQVTYFTSDTIPAPIDGGTATTTRGLAAITGIALQPPPQLVTLKATKAGCTVALQHDTLTGRVPLESGFVSIMPAYLGDQGD